MLVEGLRQQDLTSNRFLAFFVSPEYASLVSDHDFLKGIIEEALDVPDLEITSVTAAAVVIDGIPKPLIVKSSGMAPGGGWNAVVSDREMTLYSNAGEDHRSYLCNGLAPKAPVEESRQMFRDPDAERGELKLIFRTVDLNETTKKLPAADRPISPKEVRMQLANTLFHTGKIATLARHYYRVSEQPETKRLEISEAFSEDLENLTIEFSRYLLFKEAWQLPLFPLTKPRKIASGNGNIVKEIQVPDGGSTKNIRASQELEVAVTNWLARNPQYGQESLGKRPVEIFARITDPSCNASKHIQTVITQPGTRIARVLSGGGGWGMSAGILALDPQGMVGFTVPGEGILEEVHQTGALIQSGTVIQFYIVTRAWTKFETTHKLGRMLFQVTGKELESQWAPMETSLEAANAEDSQSEGVTSGVISEAITSDELSTKDEQPEIVPPPDPQGDEGITQQKNVSDPFSTRRWKFPVSSIGLENGIWSYRVLNQEADTPYETDQIRGPDPALTTAERQKIEKEKHKKARIQKVKTEKVTAEKGEAGKVGTRKKRDQKAKAPKQKKSRGLDTGRSKGLYVMTKFRPNQALVESTSASDLKADMEEMMQEFSKARRNSGSGE
ncbi:hypothetical protein H072_1182 [Dactylellina haptotyla CBS 200.50]|uniref:Uncharacterized protein n=1 Tax=Dactylellina haptotyla (strain CBS 200.50) TaxID=1284197 RepID=S8API1_DACHA|nr:hypothetical protein H072_1182 [Dactylellina haptotyla CBS 200.50]